MYHYSLAYPINLIMQFFLKNTILFAILILNSCSKLELSKLEKKSMREEISGYTMHEVNNSDVIYGKMGPFYYVTQHVKNKSNKSDDIEKEYLLYKRDQILKHQAIVCINPKQNIKLIEHFYTLLKTDTTYISSISFFNNSIRIKLDRHFNKNTFIGWKSFIYQKDNSDKWVLKTEEILTDESVFKNSKKHTF